MLRTLASCLSTTTLCLLSPKVLAVDLKRIEDGVVLTYHVGQPDDFSYPAEIDRTFIRPDRFTFNTNAQGNEIQTPRNKCLLSTAPISTPVGHRVRVAVSVSARQAFANEVIGEDMCGELSEKQYTDFVNSRSFKIFDAVVSDTSNQRRYPTPTIIVPGHTGHLSLMRNLMCMIGPARAPEGQWNMYVLEWTRIELPSFRAPAEEFKVEICNVLPNWEGAIRSVEVEITDQR